MTLRDCIEKIRNDSDSISAFNEAQAKQSIIEPILESVNWNTRDYNEVKLEHGVETLWVDYALLINGENKVFIEAKRPSEKTARESVSHRTFLWHPTLKATTWLTTTKTICAVQAPRRGALFLLHFFGRAKK